MIGIVTDVIVFRGNVLSFSLSTPLTSTEMCLVYNRNDFMKDSDNNSILSLIH